MLHKTRRISVQLLLISAALNFADNPIVQTIYTADPAPMVYNDTLWLYTGHDEDGATNFVMYDWRVYSTVDMVNWTDHGSPLSYKTFSWASAKAWAAQCVHRNGKFYWYVTAGIAAKGGQPAIGVAVGDSPIGPFRDPLNKPLASQSWDDIDPTVFVDSDGQAYLYWGNPKLYYVKLNADMISYNGGIQQIPMTTASFGTRTGDANRPTTYEEGPWFYKRGNLYYLIYPAGPLPEKIAYSTATSPTGPWTYRGQIMSSDGTNSFTNHPGIVDYKGRSYFFYHTGKLPGGHGYQRSVAVEQFSYNADGSIPVIRMTTSGPDPVQNLNPYRRIEAETMAFSRGLKTAQQNPSGIYVTKINNGDYIKLRAVEFGNPGADTILVSAACSGTGGSIEFRLDSTKILGTVTITNTGGDLSWKQFKAPLSGATGSGNLYLIFKGSGTADLFNLDYWQMIRKNTGSSSSASSSSAGSSSSSASIPYSGFISVPGIVQMEHYDLGGPGIAYYDSDTANSGGFYRRDGVDIVETGDGGYALGYIVRDEWVRFSVHISQSGTLPFTARVAANGSGGAFSLELDSQIIVDSAVVPNTGSWSNYQEISGTTRMLPAGNHSLRFIAKGSYFNIDWIRLGDSPVLTHPAANATIHGAPLSVPKTDLLGRRFRP